MINSMKELLDDIKIDNKNLEWINDYKIESYPIKWYQNKAQIELLEYLIPLLTDYIKETKKIKKLEEDYHNESAVIDDMAHKINEIIDIINK